MVSISSLTQEGNQIAEASGSQDIKDQWAQALHDLQSLGTGVIPTDSVQEAQQKQEKFKQWYEDEMKALEEMLKPFKIQLNNQFVKDVQSYGMARFKINPSSSQN